MLTTRVKIGNIQKTGDQSAQGKYWAVDQQSNATFFGTVGDVRRQFRNTQSPDANIQFDSPDGPVYVVVPSLFGFSKWTAASGISLVGGTVSSWTAAGGLNVYQTDPTKRPMFIASDPSFKGKPTIAFDNTGPEQSLIADAVTNAMAGLTQWAVEIVVNTITSGEGAIHMGMGIDPQFAGSTVANGTISALTPAIDANPHTILFTADTPNAYLYFDGLLIASGLVIALGPGAGSFGYDFDALVGYTGRMAQVSIARSSFSAAQAAASAQANRITYG
jgi:hypothetical protein